MQSLNPATGELIGDHVEHSLTELDNALVRARDAFGLFAELPVGERAAQLAPLARALRADSAELAQLMVSEMGKPIAQARAEIEKCAWLCDHFAEHGPRLLAPEPVRTEASDSFVRFDPLGPILAIMPWNFPFWQLFRCAVPALVSGNVVVLKHAENVQKCALAIERTFARGGFPSGVFTTLVVSRPAVERVVAHPAIAGVALTGSVRAGREVAALAGRQLKKCVLELGGSDPFIVLADADLGRAVDVAVKARMINSGQSCIAAKRFIVEAPIAEAFTDAFVERVKKLRVGDPLDEATDVGPLAREDLLHALHAQVVQSREQGARVLWGGERLDRAGFFYRPTVLAHVTRGMPAFDDETFGPVAALIRADDARHAIALANDSRYGLGASLWTRDIDRARELARQIHAGNVFVNSMVVSDPRLPFGGVKDSGYGRELGTYGIREFVNVKTVSIA